MYKHLRTRYGRYVLQSVTERNTSAMERETVPDTEDYILLDKIGMGMEYTREYTSIHSKFRNKYKVYRVYRYLGIC